MFKPLQRGFSLRLNLGVHILLKLGPFVAFHLLVLSFTRFIWYVTYKPEGFLLNENQSILLQAALLGLRFDLSSFAYFFMLFFLLLLLSLFIRTPSLLQLKHFLALLFTVFFAFQIIDYIYYSYFQDRLNVLVFGFFEDSTRALIMTFWENYPVTWLLILFAIFYFFQLLLLKPAFLQPKKTRYNAWQSIGILHLIFFSLIIAGRGSLGLFPLGVMNLNISVNPFINLIPSNGIHALGRAIEVKLQQKDDWDSHIKAYGYENNRLGALRDFLMNPGIKEFSWQYLVHQTEQNKNLEQHPPHVVVVMMESLSSDWLQLSKYGMDTMGSLQNHISFAAHPSKSLLYLNCMPASSATIGSISNFIINMPHRILAPFISESRYLQTAFPYSPARVYKNKGYTTRFIYGGNTGWRDLGKFASKQGFDFVEGEGEILKALKLAPSKKVLHDWGIYDEYLFAYSQKILKEAQSPQFIVLLTTANHPPYTLPEGVEKKSFTWPNSLLHKKPHSTELLEDRLNIFHYSLDQLGKWITKIKSDPSLFNQSLFAITGDHSFYLMPYDQNELLKKWTVPFILIGPPELLPKTYNPSDFLNHSDIFPTLYHLSLSEASYFSFGQNIFSPDFKSYLFFNDPFILFKINSPSDNNKTMGLGAKIHFHSHIPWQINEHGLIEAGPDDTRIADMVKKWRAMMALVDFYFNDTLIEAKQ